MKPFVQELAAKLAEDIYNELHERGITDIPDEGNFCPACQTKMSGSTQIIGYYTRPNANLWVCMDCSEAMFAERLVWAANMVKNLPFKDRVALCFKGVLPASWLKHWHEKCRRFPKLPK